MPAQHDLNDRETFLDFLSKKRKRSRRAKEEDVTGSFDAENIPVDPKSLKTWDELK